MAVSVTGTPTVYPCGTGHNVNSGTASSTITVPADCDYILCGVAGFSTTANFFGSGAIIQFTKSGIDTNMTYIGGAGTTASFDGELFGMVAPDTGTNKTLKFDFAGVGLPSDDTLLSLLFLKGVDPTTPTRNVQFVTKAPAFAGAVTPSIAANSGDKIIGFAAFYPTGGGSEGSVDTVSNCTVVANLTHQAASDCAWLQADATGAQTIGVTTTTNADDGTLVGVALIPATGGGAAPSPDIWDFVGVGNSVEVATTAHALVTTGITGLQAGDLLVAVIGSRIASTASVTLPTGGEWTLVTEQKNNNVLTTTAALPAGTMAYCQRGASDPNLTFTHPVAPSVAVGCVVAYRSQHRGKPLDVAGSVTTATAITSVSVAGVTTKENNELIVVGAVGGQEAAWSAFNATNPGTSSGAGAAQTADPITGTWQERMDVQTVTGADMSLAIADAVKAAPGATGNITATASVSAGHVILIGAFNLIARPQPAMISRQAIPRTYRY